ncbi:unnamed protein product [Moneuplotes crassus]|uniref:Uncharacterized protein n=1 Tax=Euplotes crassus TaxID=5936 RepID=A0AAD1XC60_EUPCR|nr:unnamed protein product [Moneuplotes crassus]
MKFFSPIAPLEGGFILNNALFLISGASSSSSSSAKVWQGVWASINLFWSSSDREGSLMVFSFQLTGSVSISTSTLPSLACCSTAGSGSILLNLLY